MPYIGTQVAAGNYRKLVDISTGFNGSTTSFTLAVPPGGAAEYYVTPASVNQLLISVGGVIQQPGVDFTVSTYTITFTTAPRSGLTFFGILMGDALSMGAPGDGTVTQNKIALSAFTNSISSTSTTTIATPNSVKTAYDLANAALPSTGGTMTGVINYAAAQPRLVLSTSVAASSTAVDFNGANGIPSWAKRVTVLFDQLGTTSTGVPIIKLGAASGIDSSGYNSILTSTSAAASATKLSNTTGFEIVATGLSTNRIIGKYVLTNFEGDVWIIAGSMMPGMSVVGQQFIVGRKTLAGTLTRLQVTTTGMTDTFNAGSINIMYEG